VFVCAAGAEFCIELKSEDRFPLIESVLSILLGGSAGAIVVWILRGWLTERLKQSIAHEYSEKLENHKTELEIKLQALRHQNEVNQLRTSLFFDHQRAACAQLLGKIAETNQSWWEDGYDDEVGLIRPVPWKHYQELRIQYFQHQLFLDSHSLMAMDLLFELYQDSFPFRNGDAVIERDAREAYDNIEYVQSRVAAIFRQNLGLLPDPAAVEQIALLGSIRMLNRYHFPAAGIPVTGDLALAASDRAAEAVVKAKCHLPDVLARMRAFHHYLSSESPSFHDAQSKLGRYLSALDTKGSKFDRPKGVN
jgi:hypothetical protein